MQKFTIRKSGVSKIYESPLFTVHAFRHARPLVIFSNGYEAVGVFVDRSEVATMLKRKFKNHVDRRRERA